MQWKICACVLASSLFVPHYAVLLSTSIDYTSLSVHLRYRCMSQIHGIFTLYVIIYSTQFLSLYFLSPSANPCHTDCNFSSIVPCYLWLHMQRLESVPSSSLEPLVEEPQVTSSRPDSQHVRGLGWLIEINKTWLFMIVNVTIVKKLIFDFICT